MQNAWTSEKMIPKVKARTKRETRRGAGEERDFAGMQNLGVFSLVARGRRGVVRGGR